LKHHDGIIRELRETNTRLETWGQKGIESYKAQIEYLKNKVTALEMQFECKQHVEDLHKNSI
jgi:predicted transcriptional regulator